MDDLDLLARLRPKTDDPDPVVLARHRIALLNHAADPGAQTAARRRSTPRLANRTTPDTRTTARRRSMPRLANRTDPGARTTARRWSVPRLAVGAAAVVGATAVALVVALSGGRETPGVSLPSGPSSGSAAPPATAAVVLLANAADAAAKTPAGAGEWAYTSTVSVYNDAGVRTVRRQIWEKVDGTDGLVRENRDGRVSETRTGDNSDMFPPSLRHPTYRYLATLPTDPAALRAVIYAQAQDEVEGSGPNGQRLYTVDQWAFQLIGQLAQSAAPPALKAALYRVAATVPGVEYVDDATDAAGRHGIGVAHSVNNAGDRTILIFDQHTYQVMGRAGEVHDGRTDAEAVLATGLVAKAGQTP